IIRGRNVNTKKVKALFIAQVVMGVMPVLLLVLFVWKELYHTPVIAVIFIVLIFLCNVAYAVLARNYAVLNSGVKGERRLFRTVKKLHGTNIVFHNLPVRYKRGRSELDMLIISHSGVLIIEVKNHSGTISGSWNDEKWTQRKHYRDGKVTETFMDNPIKQMRRQRDIVKSILSAAGEDVWIDTVLYFSSPNARLKLSLRENDYVCSESAELLEFLRSYERGETLSKTRMENIARILRESSGI
ncbi:MAG: nuclease-related domain-containing protein, partial [Oscillospiraceae bacterium]